MAGASLMLAHQVAGKAVRDSFFLSNYPASDLPKVVFVAAALTIVFVLLFSRAMGRFGPQRLVPASFLLSSALHIVEYRLYAGDPALWSVLIYVHIAALGAIVLSGFWSQMAESFDPRSAKQVFGRIAGAGTLGGIAGGIVAERIAAMFSAGNTLLLLATLHLACSAVLASLRHAAPGSSEAEPVEALSAKELIRRAPYLGIIAALVLAGTSSAAILDYLFKAGAGSAFGKGAPLLRFFAIFYTSTQILTFLAQTLLAPRMLQKSGIGRTLSTLPFGVGAGALAALLVPVFPVFTVVRSLELGIRGSLFRSAYELLYTPIGAAEKRRAKTLIDVGCDRAGDALGSVIVQAALWLGAPFLTSGLLGATLALAAAGFWAALRLDAAYSRLVQQRLIDRAVELDLDDIQDSTTRSAVVRAPAAARGRLAPPQDVSAGPPRSSDTTVDVLRELRSGDSSRVLAAFKEIRHVEPVVAAQLVSLLAWDEVSDAVRQILQRDPCSIAGLLTDHLVSQKEVTFGIRRRIPRILGQCDSQLAVYGLLAGLSDTRFEVRFQCSRALDCLVDRQPHLKVPPDAVFAAVERELQVARPIRESRRLLDRRDDSDPHAFLDDILRERADQTLEHVFSLFASILPREPIKIAFRALHTDDKSLHGLAIEYLDSVLPVQIRDGLSAMIETKPPAQAPEAHKDPLGELLRAHDSLLQLIDHERPSSGSAG